MKSSQVPKPWSKEDKPCRICGCETGHQFVPTQGRWFCLACGTAYREEENPAEVSIKDIWGE